MLIAGLSLWLASALRTGGLAVRADQATDDSRSGAPGVNRALSLNGKSAFVRVEDAPALRQFTNSITLEVWFRADSFYPDPGSVNSMIRKNVEAGAENFFLRFRNTDGPRLVEMGLGSQAGILQAPSEIKSNQWYHLAGTYDGSRLAVYVNGVKTKSEPVSGDLTIDSSDLFIGKGDPDFSFGEFFHGVVDEIGIWNVARSPAEILATVNAPLTGKEKGLVAYWNFDDNTANDRSGHGNNGRLQGDARIIETPRPALSPAQLQTAAAKAETDGLTPEKRLEILEALWRNLSEIYPALEYKGIQGHEWIEPAVPRVREANTDQEFYETLLQQMASLKDTHTRIVSYPGQPRQETPPVMLNQVEGKVAVIRAHPDTGLSPGEIIVSVEGRPVDECLADQMKWVCNSTDRGRIREACGQLLRGAPGTTFKVSVQGANGVRQVALRRDSRPAFWREPAISHRRLGDSIGYIRISRWTDDSIPDQFDQALVELKDTRGLIIDVRGNGGGNDQLADLVNGRLIKKPVVSSIDFWREKGTDQYHRTIGWVQPRGPWTYEGRVAVLIDEASMSACEHFVSGIEAMGTVLLVGLPTNGAGGGPTNIKLPDGTRVAISRALGLRVNGIMFEGHGIPPHIYATPTISDLRTGRDAALDIAKEWIGSGKELPPRVQALSQSANAMQRSDSSMPARRHQGESSSTPDRGRAEYPKLSFYIWGSVPFPESLTDGLTTQHILFCIRKEAKRIDEITKALGIPPEDAGAALTKLAKYDLVKATDESKWLANFPIFTQAEILQAHEIGIKYGRLEADLLRTQIPNLRKCYEQCQVAQFHPWADTSLIIVGALCADFCVSDRVRFKPEYFEERFLPPLHPDGRRWGYWAEEILPCALAFRKYRFYQNVWQDPAGGVTRFGYFSLFDEQRQSPPNTPEGLRYRPEGKIWLALTASATLEELHEKTALSLSTIQSAIDKMTRWSPPGLIRVKERYQSAIPILSSGDLNLLLPVADRIAELIFKEITVPMENEMEREGRKVGLPFPLLSGTSARDIALQMLSEEGHLAPIPQPPVPWIFGIWGWNGRIKMWEGFQ